MLSVDFYYLKFYISENVFKIYSYFSLITNKKIARAYLKIIQKAAKFVFNKGYKTAL